MHPDHARIASRLREHLSVLRGRIYGVVDGARCVDLAFEAKIHFGAEIRSLFLPELEARLWNISPYLVPIDPAGDYLDYWAQRWGENAGVLLVSDAEAEPLCEHLRRIFVVRDERQQEFFFRFYDPRVLRTFLPSCSGEQLEAFFALVQEAAIEADTADALLSFRKDGARLVAEQVSMNGQR